MPLHSDAPQSVARPFNRTRARLCLDSTRTRTAMTAAKGHARRRRARLASLGNALLSTLAFVSRIGLRLGGCGGFRVAALLRARLASLGAALLGTISFALRPGRRFGGFGGVRAAALLRVIAIRTKVPRLGVNSLLGHAKASLQAFCATRKRHCNSLLGHAKASLQAFCATRKRHCNSTLCHAKASLQPAQKCRHASLGSTVTAPLRPA